MTKKDLNQNANYEKELFNFFEPEFTFSSRPLNRVNILSKNKDQNLLDKTERLSKLKEKINSIENCNLKNDSKKLILGSGNTNSKIMIIGETPGEKEEQSGLAFQGEIGELLDKMFLAINIKREKIYLTYTINFRTPENRKPTTSEIKRYSVFLKEHISLVDPKIIILMGSTAMEAVTGLNTKISNERGIWKEIILKNKTYPLIITYSPSYLIKYPENKKYSWADLKKIKQKIQELNIEI